jgi:hypothetical protein
MAIISYAEFEAYVRDLSKLAEGAQKELLSTWWKLHNMQLDQEMLRDVLQASMRTLADVYGEAGKMLAAEFFSRTTSYQGQRELSGLLKYGGAEKQISDALERVFNAATDKDSAAALREFTERYVHNAARHTTLELAKKYRTKWARMPTSAHPCSWCVMLAGRGFVYASKKKAQQTKGGELYHPHCHCQPVAVKESDIEKYGEDNLIEGYKPSAYYAAWKDAADTVGKYSDEHQISAELARRDTQWIRNGTMPDVRLPAGIKLNVSQVEAERYLREHGYASEYWYEVLMEINLAAATDDFIAILAKERGIPYTTGRVGTERFYGDDGQPIFPGNQGFLGRPEITMLRAGDVIIDRYGKSSGVFVSPQGTPYEARALPEGSANAEFHTYVVVKDMEVLSGTVAPWFEEPGKGVQYELPNNIYKLVRERYLKEVD